MNSFESVSEPRVEKSFHKPVKIPYFELSQFRFDIPCLKTMSKNLTILKSSTYSSQFFYALSQVYHVKKHFEYSSFNKEIHVIDNLWVADLLNTHA